MIEKCITSEIRPLLIKKDNLIEFNLTDTVKFYSVAENISKETGVLEEYTYTEPYYFFIR